MYLAPPTKWLRSFSNADLSVVHLTSAIHFISEKVSDNFLAPLCQLAAELFKCRLIRRRRRRRQL